MNQSESIKTFEAWVRALSNALPVFYGTQQYTNEEKIALAEATLKAYKECELILGSSHPQCISLFIIYLNLLACIEGFENLRPLIDLMITEAIKELG